MLSDWRTNVTFSFFVTAFLLVIMRLFNIQVLNHQKFLALAQEQYWDQAIIPARRGNILSSDGYVLAGTKNHYLMFGEPKKIKDPYQMANDLAEILVSSRFKPKAGLDNEKLKQDLFKKYFDEIYYAFTLDLMWVPVQKDVTPVEKEQIKNAGESTQGKKFEGIGFEEIPVRYYPEGNLASHVLGFVASDEKGEKTGYYGIEGSLNEDLKGKPGRLTEEIDAVGLPILMGSYKKTEPVQGRDVVLTINRAVQYLIEKRLKEGVEEYNAKSGSVVVMNPFTGEVTAMANYPTYSPSDYTAGDEPNDDTGRKSVEKKNLAISDIYEPGSVIKALTISAAVDLKLVTPETTFNDEGPVWYSGHKIDTWDGKHYGVQTIIQLLQKSNNIGAAWVGTKVGRDNLYKYFFDFGLGSRTNIDLQGEEGGILRDKSEWSDISIANASFGQGLSATSLQVLNAFNVIANGGYLMQPKIISKMIDEKGKIEIPSKSIRRVISKETADTLVGLLEKASEGGEAKYFVLKDYKIAAKTGTAQIPEEGKYSPDRTNATFVGFMSGSKAFSMIVKLEEPKKSIYAAETSAPLWMEIALDLVRFYGLPSDKMPESAVKTQ